jgi:two-component system sensor histidine kinase PilS (NtrC family)
MSPAVRHLPNLERHLRWLIAFRLVMISSVLISYLVFELSSRGELPEFNLLFVIVAATYLASLLHIALLRLLAHRPLWHAYVQFAGDLALVSGLVYFFGGITSPFSMLYLVVIMVAAVILQRRAALTVAGLAYILYAILLTALARNWIPALSPLPTDLELSFRISYNLAVHLFGFFAVALLTSYLGESATRAEEELAEKSGSLANLEIFHRDVIQSISSGLISTDLAARVTSVNRAALDILGTTESALVGKPIAGSGLFSEADWAAAVADKGADRRQRSELVVARGNERLPIGFTVTRLTDADNVPTGWIVVFQDLSQWRRLQEELRLKDRMAAVGELAAGLAHEVGNPLAAISGSVQLLSSSIAAGQQERRLLDIIVKESLRLDRTIKGFLRFARPASAPPRASTSPPCWPRTPRCCATPRRPRADTSSPSSSSPSRRSSPAIPTRSARSSGISRATPCAPCPAEAGSSFSAACAASPTASSSTTPGTACPRSSAQAVPPFSVLLRLRYRYRHGDRLSNRPGARRLDQRGEPARRGHPDRRFACPCT